MQLKKKYKLLWIEDDYERLKNLVRPLIKLGFKIDHVTNLESYYEIKNIQDYHLFIVDLMIPQKKNNGSIDIDDFNPYPGLQILQEIVELEKPTLVLSIVTDSDIMKKLNEYGNTIKVLTKGDIFPSDFKYEIFGLLNIRE